MSRIILAPALNIIFNKEGLSKICQTKTVYYFSHSVLKQQKSEENIPLTF
jgi:hypothetical protein